MATFTGKNIRNTYTGLLQIDSGSIQDGLGNEISIPTTQLSGSTLISGSSQLSSDISGSFASISASLAAETSQLLNFSSSLDNTFATDSKVSDAVSGLNLATSSYAISADVGLESHVSGSFTVTSASLQNRISSNTDNIGNLHALTSSYALSSNVVQNTLTSSFAITTDVLSNTLTGSFVKLGGDSTFLGDNTFMGETRFSSSIFATGSVNIGTGVASIANSGNGKRISLQASATASNLLNANVSTEQRPNGTTRSLLYGENIFVYGDKVHLATQREPVVYLGNVSASLKVHAETQFTGSTTVTGQSLFNLLPSDPLPSGPNTGSFAVTGSTLAFYDGNNWVTVTTGSTLPL